MKHVKKILKYLLEVKKISRGTRLFFKTAREHKFIIIGAAVFLLIASYALAPVEKEFLPSPGLFTVNPEGSLSLPASSSGGTCSGNSCVFCDPDHNPCSNCTSDANCGGLPPPAPYCDPSRRVTCSNTDACGCTEIVERDTNCSTTPPCAIINSCPACNPPQPAQCGVNGCEVGESCTTCPTDCGTCSSPNPAPIGYHDGSDCSQSWGWTCDASDYSAPLDVHFYEGATFLGFVTANIPAEPAVAALCGGFNAHRFSWPTPNSLKTGTPRTITAFAINIPSGSNPPLSGTPDTITCAASGLTGNCSISPNPCPGGSLGTITWSSNDTQLFGNCGAAGSAGGLPGSNPGGFTGTCPVGGTSCTFTSETGQSGSFGCSVSDVVNTAPGVPILVSPLSNTWTRNDPISFRVRSIDPQGDTVRINRYDFLSNPPPDWTSGFFSSGSTITYSAAGIPEGPGKQWRTRAEDSIGALSNYSSTWTINIDRTDPSSGSILIDNGAPYTRDLPVDLTLTCSDALSGCNSISSSNDGVTFSSSQPYVATPTIWANWGLEPTNFTTTDETTLFRRGGFIPPNRTILIQPGPPDDTTAILAPPAGITSAGWRSKIPYTDTIPAASWTINTQLRRLGGGGGNSGRMSVRLWKSSSSNMSGAVPITSWMENPITLSFSGGGAPLNDTFAINPGSISLSNEYLFVEFAFRFITYPGNSSFRAAFIVNQPGGQANITTPSPTIKTLYLGNAVAFTSPATSWTMEGGDGLRTVYSRLLDRASNYITVSDTIILDTTAPAVSVLIDGGAAITTDPDVMLTLTCDDSSSGASVYAGCADMKFSNDGIAYSGWEAFSASKTWTLTPGPGLKTVYAEFRDATGNISTVSDTIVYNSPPNLPTGTCAGSVPCPISGGISVPPDLTNITGNSGTPAFGEWPAGAATSPLRPTFTWIYSDPNDVPPGTDPQSAYQIQIDDTTDFSSPVYDTCKQTSGTNQFPLPANGAGSCTPSTGLTYGSIANPRYKWRIQVWDSYDTPSGWSNGARFSTQTHEAPTVSFTYIPLSPRAQQLVRFTGTATTYGGTSIASQNWIFQDGNPASSVILNPDVRFQTSGGKSVSLVVVDSGNLSNGAQAIVNIAGLIPSLLRWIEYFAP